MNNKQKQMSRHRRANSDLEGLKNIKTLKKPSSREFETVGRVNRTFSEYQSKKTGKTKNCPESPVLKKVECHDVILDIYKLLQHFYQDPNSAYANKVKKYLKSDWQGQKKQFNEHLNKMTYMEQSMQKKNYSEIEEEILKEWRKNPVLYCIRAFWYDSIMAHKFQIIENFMSEYNNFRDFIGQIGYLYFHGFFLSLEKKGNDLVLDQLTERTAHFIITHSNTWNKIYDKILQELINRKILKSSSANFSQQTIQNFTIANLEISRRVLNNSADQNQLPQTSNALDKFLLQNKLFDKIQLLISIRENLEMEVQQNQRKMIENGELKKIQILDKDDFISALIYCVVKGEISLLKLGSSLRYMQTVFGADLSKILSKFLCESYFTDLEVVFDYLNQWVEENQRELRDVEIINYSFTHGHQE